MAAAVSVVCLVTLCCRCLAPDIEPASDELLKQTRNTTNGPSLFGMRLFLAANPANPARTPMCPEATVLCVCVQLLAPKKSPDDILKLFNSHPQNALFAGSPAQVLADLMMYSPNKPEDGCFKYVLYHNQDLS